MKKLLPFIILMFVFSVSAQVKKPVAKPTPTSTTEKPNEAVTQPVVEETKFTEDELKLIADISATVARLELCRYSADSEDCKSGGKWQQQLTNDYQEAVKRPRVVKYLTAESSAKYLRMRNAPSISAPQIAQIALEQQAELQPIIIAQNQRIIELLEQIAKKK